MRCMLRLAGLVAALVTWGLAPAIAQTVSAPQRPFSQLVDLWTRQLDRIATRADQADVLPVEIDGLLSAEQYAALAQ